MKKEEKQARTNEIPQEEENIGKIRDILFGNNISEIDKRFNLLEQELQQTIDALRDEVQKRLHSFDDYFKTEIKSIHEQLKQEQETRTSEVNKLQRAIDKTDSNVVSLKSELKENVRDLRSKMMDHYKENAESVATLDRDLKKLINKEVNHLTESKTDRKALAFMLSEMALKLNNGDEQ